MKRNVKELVKQMTLEEKAGMCSGKDFWHLKGVERLGIPEVMVFFRLENVYLCLLLVEKDRIGLQYLRKRGNIFIRKYCGKGVNIMKRNEKELVKQMTLE